MDLSLLSNLQSPSEKQNRILAAVDIGGSNIRCALSLIDDPFALIARTTHPTPDNTEPDAIVDFIAHQIASCLRESGHAPASLAGLGCTAPGITDSLKGIVVSAANLQNWNNVPLVDLLEKRFAVPVAVENDVNAAALGELKFGAGRGRRSLIYMTVSTGVAAGIIIEDRILRGHHHSAGEIGYMLMEPVHIGRDWGTNGCLELTAAGVGIAQQYAAARGYGETIDSAIAVFEAARRGDDTAQQIINRARDYLAQAAVALCTVIDPEILVLGGGIVENEFEIFNGIASMVQATLPFPPFVVLAELGGDSPLVGAMALALACSN